VGIVRLDPMSIVNLSNWHVKIASATFTFLLLLLVWHVSFSNLGSLHNVLISCCSTNNHGLMGKIGIASAYFYEFINMGQVPKSQSIQIQSLIKSPFFICGFGMDS